MRREPPRSIRPLLHAFSDALKDALGGELIGLYVFGSAAFPGFVPRSGDIDFIAVTRRSPSREQRGRLDRIHRKLAASFRYGALLDGCYIPLHKATRRRIPDRLTFAREGSLGTGTRDTSWAMHRHHLRAGACLILHGVAPSRLFPPATKGEIASFLRRERKYVQDHLAQYPVYAVLNLCRLEYSRRHGEVVLSKVQAARWARTQLGPWQSLIDAALRTYRGRPRKGDRSRLRRGARDFFRSLSSEP
jgi:streptomycin 3"-adenylyltransferase